MNNHWKMNRIGFVNFWLYDEEIIEFTDGKLLLRGQNGSGKSITTQSFIPFILDGDRTPSRLDPFGSSDRRMEYYFLGEGKEEATGYLFLEFKKEETKEYRTIGIGQRARRGKAMDFWGFVVLDGRRVGEDFYLYKTTGNTRLPYTKQELKKVLGEEVPFTDVPGEYKNLVNKYIFGFRRPEQYEQFIRLLVKVRAPKLSKEFKPTKVYEILNESLQTLTDEDLRAMVDAMEKMDGIQENLDQLNRAFSDVKIIRNEYTRYNQFMLARKAQGYLQKKEEVEREQERRKAQEEECQELLKNIIAHDKELGQKEERRSLANSELISLLDTDMEEADRKLDKALKDQEENRERKAWWDTKFESCHERIRQSETNQKKLETDLELGQKNLEETGQELEELQEELRWENHHKVMQVLHSEQETNLNFFTEELQKYEHQIDAGKHLIEDYERYQQECDQKAEKLEEVRLEKEAKEQEEQTLQETLLDDQDRLIVDLYRMKEQKEWSPSEKTIRQIEEKIRMYQSAVTGEEIRKTLRMDWEKTKAVFLGLRKNKEWEREQQQNRISETKAEIAQVQQQKEIEPQRSEETLQFRQALLEAEIGFVPFYKGIEFAENLSDEERSKLEAQLMQAGILDALVVAEKDFQRIKTEFPQMVDGILRVTREGDSAFRKLVVNEELTEELKREVQKILGNIYEKEGEGTLSLGEKGYFRHGILFGRAEKKGEAEFVGQLARKQKKEQMLRSLREVLAKQEEQMELLCGEITLLKEREQTLEEEYEQIPDFTKINQLLEQIKQCQFELEHLEKQYREKEGEAEAADRQKREAYQKMLQHCKEFPFGRTLQEYQERLSDVRDYQYSWRHACLLIQKIGKTRSDLNREKEITDENEAQADEAYAETQRYTKRLRELEIEIRKYEEYLNSPENREKAEKRKQLKQEIRELEKSIERLKISIAEQKSRRNTILEKEVEEKAILQKKIGEEIIFRKYFQEELSLKLVLETEEKSLEHYAKKAVGMLRESDKGREPEDLLNSLHRVYQQHNSNLANYGTSMEDCFAEAEEGFQGTRKRVRLVSVWNGKKLYLNEFYINLKEAIEETELLIQEKDRELFEDILSQTISQQLTDRIAESRKWVQDMSKLMKRMDTSMGLSFSLDWKPKTAESEEELDTQELEHILLRDRELLTIQDIERVAAHFRSKIKAEKIKMEEGGMAVNYMDLVRDALDYRRWFSFQMSFYRTDEGKKPLTNAAFNRFSGGEKAMAMYVPLFAAVNAQYQKAENKDHPRMIALDEAFAGVDDKNIGSMFELVEKLNFDYIMNSQALWGCYESVKGLKIAELHRPLNSQVITVIYYTWNGHKRILDEQ